MSTTNFILGILAIGSVIYVLVLITREPKD